MKKVFSSLLILCIVAGFIVGLFVPSDSASAQSAQIEYSKAYQVIIPQGTGSSTQLSVFPPKLIFDGEKANWLAVSRWDMDLPVGSLYSSDNTTYLVDIYSSDAEVSYVRSVDDVLIVKPGILGEKHKHDIEIFDYSIYRGEIGIDPETGFTIEDESRVKFDSYVYGSGIDLYNLEDTPQSDSTPHVYGITAVRVYAFVEAEVGKSYPTASTVIRVGTEDFSGPVTNLTESWTSIVTEYVTNPVTGSEWLWADIQTLQAGVDLKHGICYYLYVEVECLVGSQTFFGIDPVEVTPTSTGFQDVDCSSYIASGATGVVIHSTNMDSFNDHDLGLRKKGSSDYRVQDLTEECHNWAMIGVDSSRVFQARVGDVNYVDLWLVGYTMTGVTMFTNAYPKALSNTGDWYDIDCSTEAPSADGLIFEITAGSTAYDMGLRKNGSSDSRTNPVSKHNGFGAIIGCDNSQLCEGYIGSTTVDFWLLGYVTDGAIFYDNATDLSISPDGWQDLDALPDGAVMGFIEVIGGSPSYDWGLRKDGSGESITYKLNFHTWGIVECSDSFIIEGDVDASSHDFFLVGYASKIETPTVTVSSATLVTDTTARLNGEVTDTGYENPNVTVYWGDNDGGEVPGNWDFNSTPTSPSQPQGAEPFYKDVTGLSPGVLYYYTASATNSAGTGWANTTTFTTKDEPTISTQAATNIGVTLARLNAYLDDDGGEGCYVRFQYGLDESYGNNTDWVGGYITGEYPYEWVFELSANTTYHFRAQAYNTINGPGSPVNGTDLEFLTLSTVLDPSGLIAIPSATDIQCSWVKGAGSYQTLLVYKAGSYPNDRNDGEVGYLGIAGSCVIEGLVPGTTYYLRLWGYSPPDHWSYGYAQVIVTTEAGIVPGEGSFPTPEQPGNWFTSADPSRLSDMPGYGIVIDVASQLGMPSGSLFLILGMIAAVGAGVAAYIVSRDLIMLLAVSGLVLLGCSVAGIVPWWMFFMYMVFGVLIGYLLSRGRS